MIGIIPAAGHAVRMNHLPKMLLPIPTGGTLIETLCQRMSVIGARQLVVGTRSTHYEALASACNATVYRAETATMSETVLAAKPYVWEGEHTVFGMPDSFFDDAQAFVKLHSALRDGADVAVGVFYTRRTQRGKIGMCELRSGRVVRVEDKPEITELVWGWGVLAWRYDFWQHIHAADPHVGYAVQRAIEWGMDVRAVKLEGEYFDCGEPASYFELINHLTARAAV